MEHKQLFRIIKNIFILAVAVYVVCGLFYFLQWEKGIGDEALFLSDIFYLKNNGWIAAIEKGISVPYMLVAYPFTFLFEDYIALRFTNILLFLLLLFYFFNVRNVRYWLFYMLLLFFYSTVGYFLLGTNDTLFIVSLIVVFSETYFILDSHKKESLLLFGVALITALFTRALFFVYLPVVLLSLFFLLKKRKFIFRSLVVPLILFLALVAVNIPSLQKQGSFSYDQKAPPAGVSSNWAQRQYYAQLLVNEGTLLNYNHPSWEVTDLYLAKNGSEALPNSILKGMTHDPVLTVTEFFKDLFYILFYSIRQLGGLLLTVLLFGFYRVLTGKKEIKQLYVPLTVLIMLVVFASIIISFIELRWLAPVFILMLLYYSLLVQKDKIPKIVVSLNYLLITLVSLYGLYGFFQKI